MFEKYLSKTGKLMTKVPPCVHIMRRCKVINNRYDRDSSYKRYSYYCLHFKKDIKRSYCRGCVFYKPLK